MGILNVTPDSFSDGGRYQSLDFAMEHAEQMIWTASTSSTSAANRPVPARPRAAGRAAARDAGAVRAARLGPAAVGRHLQAQVMREAIIAGADMINDINGFRAPGAIEAVRDSDCGLCIMHMQGTPQTCSWRRRTPTWWPR
jgi:dihydropteroate synthase